VVINANQHQVANVPCTNPIPSPPFSDLLASTNVDASSFHVRPERWSFDVAMCYNNASKPRIVSDDWGFPAPPVINPCNDGYPATMIQQCYVRDLCATVNSDPTNNRGLYHYEHFDKFMETRLQNGNPVHDFGHWPTNSVTFIEWLQDNGCGSQLEPNGALNRDSLSSKLRWRDYSTTPSTNNAVTLIGSGPMGALVANARLSIEPFVHQLRLHEANLFRVWALDQWVALCDLSPGTCLGAEGLTPFPGTRSSQNYNLSQDNPAFFNRLRTFAQLASDHGVIMQLSLFDKHGLIDSEPLPEPISCIGKWDSSPFKSTNNTQSHVSQVINDCNCDSLTEPHVDNPLGNCRPPDAFVDTTNSEWFALGSDTVRFLESVVREVGGAGNVVLEIINEQWAGTDWPFDRNFNGIADGEEWQLEVASNLRYLEPDIVARDAFNGRNEGEALTGTSDTGQAWTSSHVKVDNLSEETDTGFKMGRAVSTEAATFMRAHLSLASDALVMDVSADLSYSNYNLQLGFQNNSESDTLYFGIRPTASPLVRELVLAKKLAGQTTVLRVKTLNQPTFSGHVRIVAQPYAPMGSGAVDVYVDSVRDPDLSVTSGVYVPVTRAFFGGWRNGGAYTSAAGAVDNFVGKVRFTSH
jgi:hypothetical protein